MLVCYARELDEEFAEYTQQVAELMTRLLKFYFHEGVRVSAAEIMPYLLQSGAAKGAYAGRGGGRESMGRDV